MENENLCFEDQSANLCFEDQSANLCFEDQSGIKNICISLKDKNNMQQFVIVKIPINCNPNLIDQQVRQSINDEKFTERGIIIINSEDIAGNNLDYFQRYHLSISGRISGRISGHMIAEHHPVEIINCSDVADDLKTIHMRNPAFDNPAISIRNYRNDFNEDMVQPWTEKLSASKHICQKNLKLRKNKKKSFGKNKNKKK